MSIFKIGKIRSYISAIQII